MVSHHSNNSSNCGENLRFLQVEWSHPQVHGWLLNKYPVSLYIVDLGIWLCAYFTVSASFFRLLVLYPIVITDFDGIWWCVFTLNSMGEPHVSLYWFIVVCFTVVSLDKYLLKIRISIFLGHKIRIQSKSVTCLKRFWMWNTKCKETSIVVSISSENKIYATFMGLNELQSEWQMSKKLFENMCTVFQCEVCLCLRCC
jgi:hypothetical protein